MLILGLTGNIGCGKSCLSSIFKEYNIDIIDADVISRQIFEDKKVLNSVFQYFGEEIKNIDGTLNRKALGNIVFNNNKKLIALNNLTHPKIKENIISKTNELKTIRKKIVVIDGALLVEGNYIDIIDKLLVVTCKENVQIKRIITRDNCSIEEALSRVNSQMNQDEKSKYADYIIDNSGTIKELKEKANNFILYIKENWCG
ncbi:dephospho-CoA kinase [Romboutsia sp.]|uniref:dephospho-CoA kinase n=1 Tax=Romboutsia sp. TaxID=1965302 RepID=UPI003F37F917